jgi:diguanylate cyclase (GGDEF)-like protein
MDDPSVALAASVFSRSFASFEEATSTVLTVLKAQLPGSGIVLGRFDRITGVYRVIASAGDASLGLVPVVEVPLADAFCADLAGWDAAVLCGDARRAPVDPSAPGAGLGSFVGVALELSDGEHVGALCAVSPEVDQYTEADLHLITVVGRVLAYEMERQLQAEALERMAAELARNARADDLTGLLNRAAFDAELQREWTLTSRDWTQSHLLLVDIDGFRGLNDQFGHTVGDAALSDLTDVLRTVTRSTDVVGRVGGDRFAVILVRTTGGCDAVGLTGRLRTELERVLEARPYRFGISVGHCSLLEALSPDDAVVCAESHLMFEKGQRQPDPVLDLQ